mmetsp:Transcript_7219/g.19778  ORF Transcript_7219/g.19778 Transcript_7219/m.19778 type:complete len:209 (-) Transcript_7219:610-1236(-)
MAPFQLRAVQPLYRHCSPFSRASPPRTPNVVTPPSATWYSCMRVLATSNGVVTAAAKAPATAPAVAFARNTSISVGDPPSGSSLPRIGSTDAQYNPLNGTSRHNVAPTPRHNRRPDVRPDVRPDPGVASAENDPRDPPCSRVRINSIGLVQYTATERANIPASNGASGRKGDAASVSFEPPASHSGLQVPAPPGALLLPSAPLICSSR